MFESLPQRASAVDACASSLREAILEGRIAVGERLPPERDLALQFGVNRVTVRSALGRLAAAGLLSVRQGSGYLVRDYRRVGGPDLAGALCDLARKHGDLASAARDLLFVRSCLAEGVLVRLVESPPSRAARAKIDAAVDVLASRVAEGSPKAAIAEADIDVLAAILDATESPVLRLFLNPVTALLGDLPELVEAIYATPEESVVAFRALAAFLARPDASVVGAIVAAMRERDARAVARLGTSRRPRTRAATPAASAELRAPRAAAEKPTKKRSP